MHIDNNYHKLLETILADGYWYDDPNREGVRRLEIPSYTFRHEFKDGFPAVSTKKLFFKQVNAELIWFLSGNTNIKNLIDNGCNIWNKDAYKYYLEQCEKDGCKPLGMQSFLHEVKGQTKLRNVNYTFGDLGPVYGKQWVDSMKVVPTGSGHYKTIGVNQIQALIEKMVMTPMSSELIVNAWNPTDLSEMALPPCHYGFQIVMRPLGKLERMNYGPKIMYFVEPSDEELDKDGFPKYGFELHWNQRSCDTFLGIPFNIASYAELALILEQVTGHKALAIQGDLKKVHLYENSIEGVKEQLSRTSNNVKVKLDYVDFDEPLSDYYQPERGDSYFAFIRGINECLPNLQLINYEPQPAIKVDMLERSV